MLSHRPEGQWLWDQLALEATWLMAVPARHSTPGGNLKMVSHPISCLWLHRQVKDGMEIWALFWALGFPGMKGFHLYFV